MLEYTGVNVEIQYVDAEQLDDSNLDILDKRMVLFQEDLEKRIEAK